MNSDEFIAWIDEASRLSGHPFRAMQEPMMDPRTIHLRYLVRVSVVHRTTTVLLWDPTDQTWYKNHDAFWQPHSDPRELLRHQLRVDIERARDEAIRANRTADRMLHILNALTDEPNEPKN